MVTMLRGQMGDGRLGQKAIKYLRMTVAGLELQGEGQIMK